MRSEQATPAHLGLSQKKKENIGGHRNPGLQPLLWSFAMAQVLLHFFHYKLMVTEDKNFSDFFTFATTTIVGSL
jgi:hypothetical protein